MKAIVIGIMPQETIRERVLSIARGEYKPKAGEPKVWFTSMRSLAEVLSDENRALLQLIKETKPHSITSLAETTGRKPGNLSRTLRTMHLPDALLNRVETVVREMFFDNHWCGAESTGEPAPPNAA